MKFKVIQGHRFDTMPARDRRTDGQTRCDHYYPR